MLHRSATGRQTAILDGLVQVRFMDDESFLNWEPPRRARRSPTGPRPHTPALLNEVLEFLAPKPEGIYLDATIGTGGHAEAVLARLSDGGLLIGVDRDAEVLEVTRRRLRKVDSEARVLLRAGDFAGVADVCRELGVDALDGIVADLGFSSWQLGSAERGFSHTIEGPLDMRFDRNQAVTAGQVLAQSSLEELTRILARYGEEPHAKRIAQAILRRRGEQPLETTTDLAEVVRSAVPRRAQPDALARTFQALRIVVNGEIESLKGFLRVAPGLLSPGGRLVVVSFHSLEDRQVKRALQECERAGIMGTLTAKPQRPGAREVSENPRSRSAKLRAAKKVVLTGFTSPGLKHSRRTGDPETTGGER